MEKENLTEQIIKNLIEIYAEQENVTLEKVEIIKV